MLPPIFLTSIEQKFADLTRQTGIFSVFLKLCFDLGSSVHAWVWYVSLTGLRTYLLLQVFGFSISFVLWLSMASRRLDVTVWESTFAAKFVGACSSIVHVLALLYVLAWRLTSTGCSFQTRRCYFSFQLLLRRVFVFLSCWNLFSRPGVVLRFRPESPSLDPRTDSPRFWPVHLSSCYYQVAKADDAFSIDPYSLGTPGHPWPSCLAAEGQNGSSRPSSKTSINVVLSVFAAVRDPDDFSLSMSAHVSTVVFSDPAVAFVAAHDANARSYAFCFVSTAATTYFYPFYFTKLLIALSARATRSVSGPDSVVALVDLRQDLHGCLTRCDTKKQTTKATSSQRKVLASTWQLKCSLLISKASYFVLEMTSISVSYIHVLKRKYLFVMS